MTSKRLFFLLVGLLVIIVVGGIASVVLGNTMLQDKSTELTSLKVESHGLEEQQRSLIQAKKEVEAYSSLEQIARTVVPQDKDQARTVREIVTLAAASGVGITNISFPTSTLGQDNKKPARPTGDSESTPKPATPSTTQVEPVTGIAGVYQMDITVQSSSNPVPYQNFLNFLDRLEQNRRTAQVINLSVQPSSGDRNLVTFNLVLRVYIKP